MMPSTTHWTQIVFILCLVAGSSLAEWSDWEEFGNCSRPCAGGLANKTRECIGDSGTCKGHHIRFRVCNQQPCEQDSASLRELQCRSFNNVALKDNYYHWEPHYSPQDPCVLFCKAQETGVVLKMEHRVWNGTKCGQRGGGVCILGRCKNVGCDGVVGSRRKRCPPCRGDTCTTLPDAKHHNNDRNMVSEEDTRWVKRWGRCSETCGSGIQTEQNVCVITRTGRIVDDKFCDAGIRPASKGKTKRCNSGSSCHFKWYAFEWSSCSRTCGDGFKYRSVLCMKHNGNDRKSVHSRKCSSVMPDTRVACNLGVCPEWLTGPWSTCSVTCGYGQQKRKVVCKTPASEKCNSVSKPAHVQKCYSGNSCFDGEGASFQQDDSSASRHDFFDDAKLQEMFARPQYEVSPWGTCTVTCGVGYRHRNISCTAGGKHVPLSQCKGLVEPHIKRECHQERCPPSVSRGKALYRWQHGNFGACSRSCGKGIQASQLECADVENNRPVLDSMCAGQAKPEVVKQFCNMLDCPPSWRVGEYSACTLPCGGGRQSRDVQCGQVTSDSSVRTIASFRCPDPIPLSLRSCNEHFCQAEWQYGRWGECSVTCGVGVESRSVFCVKYVKTGLQVNVSAVDCIAPRPPATRQCHLGDCYKLQHLPEIREKNGTFIQIKRSKRVGLVVGEVAILLPNQAVKIRCPVKNFSRKLIFWTKDHRLIPMVGRRVRVSSNGALRISRANPLVDRGIFTCTAGVLQANIEIKFQTKKEARMKAAKVMKDIYEESLNDAFTNRPQADEMSKLKENMFNENAMEKDGVYDYSSFTTTNWTACSANCGPGTQTRAVTCNHVTDKFIRLLPVKDCMKKGLVRPDISRDCMIQKECPHWITGNWTGCSTAHCRREGFAVDRRPIKCQYSNGTLAKHHMCDKASRPQHKRKCRNPECIATWHTSAWSECRPRCGVSGTKLRTLECVWEPNKKRALHNCKRKPRPVARKRCKPKPCPQNRCSDSSRHCRLVSRLRLCRYQKFQWKCCITCRRANLS